MAAVLSCGPGAVLSHRSAAALWRLLAADGCRIEVSVALETTRRRGGIVVHRRKELAPNEVTRCNDIPVTTPLLTLIDIAASLQPRAIEAAVIEADKLDLIDHQALRSDLDAAVR
jgi:hypothetical protein